MKSNNFYGEENYYYEPDYGWKLNRNCVLDELNEDLFNYLEMVIENNYDKVAPTTVIFCFLSLFVFAGSSQAQMILRENKKFVTQTVVELIEPEQNLTGAVKIIIKKSANLTLKKHRLGYYAETPQAAIILKIFELESSKKISTFLPQTLPNVPLMSHHFLQNSIIKTCRLNISTNEIVPSAKFVNYSTDLSSNVLNLLVNRLKLKMCLLPGWVPLPPFLKLASEAVKFINRKRINSKNGDEEFDFIKNTLSNITAGNKARKQKNIFSKVSLLPGTILLLLMSFLRKEKLERAVSGVLEVSGIIKKRTLFQKIFDKITPVLNPTKPYLFAIVTTTGIVYVIYINRASLMKKLNDNPIALSFEYMNNFLNEYKRVVEVTLISAQKLTSETFKRVYMYADKDIANVIQLSKTLEASRIENKLLTEQLYHEREFALTNGFTATKCIDDLALKKVELVKKENFIVQIREHIEGVKVGALDAPIVEKVQNLLTNTFHSDNFAIITEGEEYKRLYEHFQKENAIQYPILKMEKDLSNLTKHLNTDTDTDTDTKLGVPTVENATEKPLNRFQKFLRNYLNSSVHAPYV